MQHISKREIIEAITPVIQNTCVRYSLIPVEISFEKENGKWFLRIFIFSNDHEISHKDCENVIHGLGDMLDEIIPFKYYLEVSSLGLDRKMKSDIEYTIFKGKKIIIKTNEPVEENYSKKFNAKIIDFQKGLGLRVLNLENEKEYLIKEENISSCRLNEE